MRRSMITLLSIVLLASAPASADGPILVVSDADGAAGGSDSGPSRKLVRYAGQIKRWPRGIGVSDTASRTAQAGVPFLCSISELSTEARKRLKY